MHQPNINQTFSYGIPSKKSEYIPDIINHVHMENYLKDLKSKEDSKQFKWKLIFKDAKETKSYGLWLKALENFKKTFDEHWLTNWKDLNWSGTNTSPTKVIVDPNSLFKRNEIN